MLAIFRHAALGTGALALCAGLAVAAAGTASAAPIELTRTQFTTATAGLPQVIETFEGFTTGNHLSPLTLSNGTYAATDPFIVGLPDFCGNATRCLIDNSSIDLPRTFSAFPVGTEFWGTDFSVSSSDVFQVTVTGGSGTAVFTGLAADFWGFGDPAGLTSVTFVNMGRGGISDNYAFDNVVTAGTVAEPGSLALFGGGLLAFFGILVKRKPGNGI